MEGSSHWHIVMTCSMGNIKAVIKIPSNFLMLGGVMLSPVQISDFGGSFQVPTHTLSTVQLEIIDTFSPSIGTS